MDIRHNFILIHLGNSDIGIELVRELYRLKNHLVIVSKCQKHLDFLKKQFPKIDRINCDINKEEDLSTLVKTCKTVYPFLDIIVHHDFSANFSDSTNHLSEISENAEDAMNLSNRLLPIFSKKSTNAMIFTTIDTKSIKIIGEKNVFQKTTLFSELEIKMSKKAIEMVQINIPINLLKIESSKIESEAIKFIGRFLKDFEKGKYLSLKERKSNFGSKFKNLRSLFFEN